LASREGKSEAARNVGNLKGVGRVYQLTFIDTYVFAKVYDRKTPRRPICSTTASFLSATADVTLLRVLTGRGSEYSGNPRAARV